MKVLVICFICAVFSSATALNKEFIEKYKEELKQVGAKCLVEANAGDADVAALLAHQIPESHEGKCMIFCLHKHFHVMNEDGSLDPDGAMKSLEPLKAADPELHGKMETIFANCGASAVIDADPCITAASLNRCATDESKKMGLSSDVIEI